MSARPPPTPTGNAGSSNGNSSMGTGHGAGSHDRRASASQQQHETPLDHYDYEEDYDEEYDDEEYESDGDMHEDLADYYDRKLEIEESWLAWEQSIAVKNRNNRRPHHHQGPDNTNSAAGMSGLAMPARITAPSISMGRATIYIPGAGGENGSAGSPTGRSRAGSQTPAEAAAIERLRNLRGSGRGASGAAIVESYSTLSWEEKRRARRERLAAKHMVYEPSENLICLLPIELLTHMFSYLEPRDLFNASLVCPLFYHVVNADSCWKMAFDKFFGSRAPFNRLDTRSWRAEYFRRTQLLRKWDRGRGLNLVFDPKIGTVKNLWMAEDGPGDGWILAGSLELGIVARCDPQRGKVHRDIIYPSSHLVQTRSVTAIDFDRYHVFWGLSGGEVAVTRLTKAATDRTIQTMRGAHAQQVTCVKLLPSHFGVVLSGDSAGVIKAWDTRENQNIRYFVARPPQEALEIRESIVALQCNPTSHLIAGTASGRLYIWEVDLFALTNAGSEASTANSSPAQSTVHLQQQQQVQANQANDAGPPAHMTAPKRIDLPLAGKRIRYLETHFENGAGLIMVGQEDATTIQIYSAYTFELVGVLQSPAHYAAITACAWDPPRAPEKPMIPSAPSKASHEPGLFVTGDAVGNICTWVLPWELATQPTGYAGVWTLGHIPKSPEEALSIRPSCVLKGHDAEISSLFIDRVLVVSGCLQGKVKAWNPLNGELIRIIHSTRMSHPTAAKAVTCIKVNSQKCRGAVSVGGLIKSWDYSGDVTNQAKDKQRKVLPKRSNQTSVLQRRKVQYDIKQSLEETISLKRLEDQARERREQLHRRYNRLDRSETDSKASPMTEEELIEYVMMLSRDHQVTLDERAIARQVARIHAMEGVASTNGINRALRSIIESKTATMSVASGKADNAGEGSSEGVSFVQETATTPPAAATTLQSSGSAEDDEEEELVRRAIEMSMADMGEQSSSMHDDEVARFLNSPSPQEEHVAPIDVDALPTVSEMAQEDQAIVREILKELELEEAEQQLLDRAKQEQDEWPTLSSGGVASAPAMSFKSVTTTLDGADVGKVAVEDEAGERSSGSSSTLTTVTTPLPAKKSWSTVAKGSLPSGPSTSPPTLRAIRVAMEEEEDEDVQLAKILSLSMVEK